MEECSFEAGNLTCPHSSEVEDNYELEEGEGGLKKIPGWPIIVRKASWKTSLVVGLWQNLSQITMIDNEGIKWASKIVAQSLQIQYLPSCRGPGKEKCTLKFQI